jgi:hypothetical protein
LTLTVVFEKERSRFFAFFAAKEFSPTGKLLVDVVFCKVQRTHTPMYPFPGKRSALRRICASGWLEQ